MVVIPNPHVPDVFTYLDSKPALEEIYVVGSGPNMTKGIDRIPPDAITLALNGAIMYPRDFVIWMVFDVGIRNYKWWPNLKLPSVTTNIFGVTLVNEHYGSEPHKAGRIVPHYQFHFRPSVTPQWRAEVRTKHHTSPLIHGVLRGGCSIAGAAFQFAAWAGCKRLVLCGVDMVGGDHFDGFVNHNMPAGAEWGICAKLRWLVGALDKFHGCKVVSLTKTALNVPLV